MKGSAVVGVIVVKKIHMWVGGRHVGDKYSVSQRGELESVIHHTYLFTGVV